MAARGGGGGAELRQGGGGKRRVADRHADTSHPLGKFQKCLKLLEDKLSLSSVWRSGRSGLSIYAWKFVECPPPPPLQLSLITLVCLFLVGRLQCCFLSTLQRKNRPLDTTEHFQSAAGKHAGRSLEADAAVRACKDFWCVFIPLIISHLKATSRQFYAALFAIRSWCVISRLVWMPSMYRIERRSLCTCRDTVASQSLPLLSHFPFEGHLKSKLFKLPRWWQSLWRSRYTSPWRPGLI